MYIKKNTKRVEFLSVIVTIKIALSLDQEAGNFDCSFGGTYKKKCADQSFKGNRRREKA